MSRVEEFVTAVTQAYDCSQDDAGLKAALTILISRHSRPWNATRAWRNAIDKFDPDAATYFAGVIDECMDAYSRLDHQDFVEAAARDLFGPADETYDTRRRATLRVVGEAKP